MFFDDTTREFIQSYAKQKFRSNRNDRDAERAQRTLKQARTALHLLERANRGIFTDVLSVLEYGYGRKGPRKLIMLEATVGIGQREEVFGNLNEVAKYRPAFYALAEHQLGRTKLEVSVQTLRSQHPLNVAKAQDAHWQSIRHRVLPPVDAATMDLLEERAATGVVTSAAQVLASPDAAALVRAWEARWVKFPEKRMARRYYRRLLESVVRMDVVTEMVPNPGMYQKGVARRNTCLAPGVVKPELVPRRVYAFVTSSVAGKALAQEANIIDIAGLDLDAII
ncbi:hypothetical protein IWW50_005132 [Coemansia erecta]|nr:hypothetical protein GGF43_004460 [Coemansia sp. RSA 2618]KAJ2820242.1 hypothetical protein IWW50_005132 [Coemansia erecta]